eukprot:Nitzschia sp. Nitz4//scaffold200_size39268//12528//13193//NITZ4_007614-RA/size39268-processed-gene-0.13-mRNA-1//-1//CDS//3329541280//2382//frame0
MVLEMTMSMMCSVAEPDSVNTKAPQHQMNEQHKEKAKKKIISHNLNVQFAEDLNQEFTIETRKKLNKKEKQKRWLTSEDYLAQKEDSRKALGGLKNSSSAVIFDYRGLELVDPASTAKRQRHHTNSVTAVLLEQKEQRKSGIASAKAIKKVYKATVANSVKEALENAYMDKKSVAEYLENTMEELSREQRSSRAGAKQRGLSPIPRRRSFLKLRTTVKGSS